MKRFLSILFLAVSWIGAHAATITGPIYLAYSNAPYTGTLLFRPLSTPLPLTPQLITGGDFRVQTATNGVFSVDLAPGNYRVTVGADKSFTIDVPTNAATYTLLERITNSLAWNSSISPRTNSYATANNSIEGVVRTYTAQGSPVVWTTNDTAAMAAYLGQIVYPSVDAMLAAPPPLVDGVKVICLGRNAANDGGGGDFFWNASSTSVTNAGAVHGRGDGNAGRYFRSTSDGFTSTRQWGIFPGTVTETQVATLNAAIAYNAANGMYTRMDTGTHLVQTNIQLVSNSRLIASPESVWLRDYTLQSQYHKALFSVLNAPLFGDTVVKTVPIVATNIALNGIIAGASSTNKLGPLIALLGVDYGRIENCEIRPGAYDWSITYYGHNAIIAQNRIKSVFPDEGSTIFTDGIHITGGTNGVIANNSIETGDDNIAFSLFNNVGISHWVVDGNTHKSWRANAVRFQQESTWGTNLIQHITINGGAGEAGLLRNGCILFYNPSATNNPYPFRNISISHYKLRGGGLDGQPAPIGLSYGIHATGVDGLKLIDVSLENTPYGNYIWGCKDVTINDCKFTGGLYSAGFLAPLRVQDCTDLKISGGRFVPDLTTVASVQIVSVTNSVISGGAYIEGKNNGQPALLFSLYNGSVKVLGNKIVNTAVGGAAIVFANDPLNAIVAGNTLSATTPLFWSATGLPPKGSRVHWNDGIPEKETEGTTFDVLNTANNGYVGSVNSRANATKLQIQATNGMITLAQDGVSGGTKNIRLGAQPSDAAKVDNAIAYSSDNGGATQLTLNGGTGLMNSHQILNLNITTNSYEGTGWTAFQLTYRGLRLEKGVTALASPDSFFQVVSTEHGSRPIPLLTTAQANAISVQNQGLWIWDTDEVSPLVSVGAATSRYRYLLPRISADRGDADVTLISTDAETQIFNTTLTANRTVNLPASNVRKGDRFRIVRTGTGAFTLNVGGIKTIPASTAATVDVQHNGTVWQIAGYMEHTPSGGGGGGGVPTGRLVSTANSLTGGGDLSADRTLQLVNDSASPGANKVYGTDGSGVRGWKNDPAGGGGAPTTADYLVKTADAGLSAERVVGDSTSITANWGTAGAVSFERAAISGHVSIPANSNTATIPNSTVTDAMLANMGAGTIKANVTGSSAAPTGATLSQVLDLVGSAAQGDILYRGSSGWNRLPAGTLGNFLKSNGTGADPAWDIAVGSANQYILFDDFTYGTVGSATGFWTVNGANVTQAGAVAVNRPGVLQFTTSTSSTGTAFVHNGTSQYVFGGGDVSLEFSARITTAVPDGTETYALWMGFHDSTGSNTATDGAYFLLTSASANWQTVTAKAGTRTSNTSSTAAVNGTWQKFRIDINAACTSIAFYIDGTLIATHTTNLPDTTSNNCGIMFDILKSLGTTARQFQVDYVRMTQPFTTSR